MKFIPIVVFVVVSAAMGSLMTFMDKSFGKPYGTITLFSIVIGGGILGLYLITRHNKKVLKARAEITKNAEDSRRSKTSKDWV
ncbi:MAG: hypothetical protein COB83_09800 [Gammaproteobacteria bacterium]|nr:MAG: hypothetical protein COB83_09800 [Gammaproteobacteria bacterium]